MDMWPPDDFYETAAMFTTRVAWTINTRLIKINSGMFIRYVYKIVSWGSRLLNNIINNTMFIYLEPQEIISTWMVLRNKTCLVLQCARSCHIHMTRYFCITSWGEPTNMQAPPQASKTALAFNLAKSAMLLVHPSHTWVLRMIGLPQPSLAGSLILQAVRFGEAPYHWDCRCIHQQM